MSTAITILLAIGIGLAVWGGDNGQRSPSTLQLSRPVAESSERPITAEPTRRPQRSPVTAGCADGASKQFTYPVRSRQIVTNGDFSAPRDYGQHGGLDFDGKIGDPVYPVAAGIVANRGYDPDGYGYYVYIDHGDGITSRYAHLNDLHIENGVSVTPNRSIGEVGNSGDVIPGEGGDGSHLHLEIHCNQQGIDPEPLLT